MRKDKVWAHLHYSIHKGLRIARQKSCIHTNTNQYVNMKVIYRAMESKGYTQTEKLQQMGQI